MALLYADQFVGYATTGVFGDVQAYLGDGWVAPTSAVNNSTENSLQSLTLDGMAYPTTFLQWRANSAGRTARYFLQTPANLVVIGFMYRQSSVQKNTNAVVFNANLAMTGSSQTNAIRINLNGSVSINGQTSLTGLFDINGYPYFTCVCDVNSGEIRVYLDSDLTTPIVTGSTSITSVSSVGFGIGVDSTGVTNTRCINWFANMYILDDTGPAPFNAPLGVITYKPLGLESIYESNFLPNGTADPIAAINKTTRNFDTYNKSTLMNTGDLFNIVNNSVAAQDTILGVVNHVTATRDSGNPRSLNMVISDGVNTISKNKSDLPVSSWVDNDFRVFETAPDGTPWTFEKLAGLKVGYSAAN